MAGITANEIHKMTKYEATIKVRLAHSRENSRSTTTKKSSGEDQGHSYNVQEPDNDKTELVVATVGETHNIYTDQVGKFPITSSWGNKYILIMYVYDYNSILSSPLNSISGIQIL